MALNVLVGFNRSKHLTQRIAQKALAAEISGQLRPGGPILSSRRGRVDTERDSSHDNERAINQRALSVLRRVKSKLGGSDFPGEKGGPHDVATQVTRLIGEAQSNGNLCQLYIGWCPFW